VWGLIEKSEDSSLEDLFLELIQYFSLPIVETYFSGLQSLFFKKNKANLIVFMEKFSISLFIHAQKQSQTVTSCIYKLFIY
jgi:hypothetical protein